MSRLASRLTATTLAAAAALAVAALPASAADHGRHYQRPERSQVVLGSVHDDSSGRHARSNRSLNEEWVTVVNTGRRSVNLSGWTLSNSDHRTYRFTHLRLAGHSSVRVHTGVGRDTAADVYQDRRASVWNDDRDTATLRDDNGRVADTKSWGRYGHRR